MTEELAWHRRHALMLASQLPEDYANAIAVIRALQRLADEYIRDPDKPPTPVFKLREV